MQQHHNDSKAIAPFRHCRMQDRNWRFDDVTKNGMRHKSSKISSASFDKSSFGFQAFLLAVLVL